MIGHGANRRRPGDESVLVVVAAVVVEVADEDELAGVPFPDQILPENIGHVDLLMAAAELVQVGISVLLQHVERGDVPLPAVVVVIAENADAEIGVVENKTSEIAHEWLNADARRNEIVVAREIAEVELTESFLERIKFLFPRCPL